MISASNDKNAPVSGRLLPSYIDDPESFARLGQKSQIRFFLFVRLIRFTDWESNAPSMTVHRGQNVYYVPSL